MGGILTLPNAIISTVANHGVIYTFRYIITYIYLTISRCFRKRRFDLYDYFETDPEKNTVLVHPDEWALDPPIENANLQQDSDDAFCWGVNSKSESVVAHISRQPGDKVLCSLILRLSDGRTFSLPEDHQLQSETSELNTFGSARFKLQCLSPMRLWRLFFNGTLRVHSKDQDPADLQKFEHVKFTFTWTASSEIFDFTTDLSIESLSSFVASSNSYLSTPKSLIKKLTKILNGYEQPGMLLGTINVGKEDEKEVYLWGLRGRHLGQTRELNVGDFEKTYVNFSNGALMHLGHLTIPELSKKFEYGYLMRSDGFIRPILKFHEEISNPINKQITYKFKNSGKYHALVRNIDENSDVYQIRTQFPGHSFLKVVEMILNDEYDGNGFIIHGTIHASKAKQTPNIYKSLKAMSNRSSSGKDLCLPFQNVLCQDSELTGGKGSSLGKLYAMSNEAATKPGSPIPQFTVPNGVVVTTKSYNEFIQGALQSALDKFEKNVWSTADDKIQALCQSMMEVVKKSKLPKNVILAVTSSLNQEFKDKLSEAKFAVRSSATGEDTEQMSAAGQMETFLGLKGTEQILEAVIKCWASQFAFQAVEYKRRYGQRLNTPMAVVIQEMIPCDVAGVCFTCDPVTGNPAFISITANFGLGESVVSASAEPDTIVLERNINDTLVYHSQQLGNKKKKIVMDGSSGTIEIDVEGDQSSQCCINEEMSLCLGKIAVAIENRYGSSRDLEWGIIDKKIFLFQSRPVTSLDLETDFESKHVMDTYMRTENECFSKANVGEVMPAAHSPLGLDVMQKLFSLSISRQKYIKWAGSLVPNVPYYAKNVIISFTNLFFCMIDGFLGLEDDDFSKAMIIAIFGRIVDLTPMKIIAAERHKLYEKPTKDSPLQIKISTILAMFVGGKICRYHAKTMKLDTIPITNGLTSSELFRTYAESFEATATGTNGHMYCTMASSMWNLMILSHLAKAQGDFNTDVYSDFAYLLSTCTEVESADVPAAIQNLGHTISNCTNVQEFKKKTPDEALHWLRTTTTEAGVAFKSFLSKHGHRCLKEFDVFTDTWEYNPMPLVKMLQSFVTEDVTEMHKVREMPSFSTILSKMHIQLNFWQRLILRFLLPFSQTGVRDREFSKSWLIRIFNSKRKPLKELSKIMVKEGRLPRKELLFFLSVDEVDQLLKTRSPKLVAKAFHRWKVHSELDKLKFPEIMYGIPKPSNSETFIFPSNGDVVKMIGIPVSQGVVKATARVIVCIEEATTIQRGDILITYSTDIAWSPYFPLLSGVVTELGGLISHGAVVAREYGLPCVVGLHGATNVFKSGDVVILDGNKGTITKVDE